MAKYIRKMDYNCCIGNNSFELASDILNLHLYSRTCVSHPLLFSSSLLYIISQLLHVHK